MKSKFRDYPRGNYTIDSLVSDFYNNNQPILEQQNYSMEKLRNELEEAIDILAEKNNPEVIWVSKNTIKFLAWGWYARAKN